MAPEKPGHLLMRAFLVMREPNGLTLPQIVKFYRSTHDVPVRRAALLVQRALRQAEEQGFVARVRNRFVLGMQDAPGANALPEIAQGGGGLLGGGGGGGGGLDESTRRRFRQSARGFRESKRRRKSSGSKKRRKSKAKKKRRRR